MGTVPEVLLLLLFVLLLICLCKCWRCVLKLHDFNCSLHNASYAQHNLQRLHLMLRIRNVLRVCATPLLTYTHTNVGTLSPAHYLSLSQFKYYFCHLVPQSPYSIGALHMFIIALCLLAFLYFAACSCVAATNAIHVFDFSRTTKLFLIIMREAETKIQQLFYA